jgi:hypothetical protein
VAVTETIRAAAGLPPRAEFVLLHCHRPMRFGGSVAQLNDERHAVIGCRYECDTCEALLDLTLTEGPTTT